MATGLQAGQTEFTPKEYKLVRACVKSVVCNLKHDLAKLQELTNLSQLWYQTTGDYILKIEDQVTMYKMRLWFSVTRMKWIQADGVTASWFEVKELGPCPHYKWILIDQPERVRVIQAVLAEECGKESLCC